MPPVDGKNVVIQAAATSGGAGTPVNDLTRFSRRRSRTLNRTAVFMRTVPYVNMTQRAHSFTISGLRNNTDAGQTLLRDAELNGTSVWLTILFDGTNGFKQECLLTEISDDATPESLLDYGFSCEGVADPTIVGTGPLN